MSEYSQQGSVKINEDVSFYECFYCKDTGDIIMSEYCKVSYDIDEITEFGRNDIEFIYSENMLLCKVSGDSDTVLIGGNKYEKYYCSHRPEISVGFTAFSVTHGNKKLNTFSSLNKAESFVLFNFCLEDGDVSRVPSVVARNGGHVLYEDFEGEILYISEEVIQ